MVDLKLSKKRLAMHWHYYYWKYTVFIVAALFVANFLFTATTPKAPPEQRVDIVIFSASIYSTDTDVWENGILRMLPPDQKEVTVTATSLMEGQESTMYQLVAARMAAGEGNVWILPREYFLSNAASGAYMPLDGLLPSLRVPESADLSAGKLAVATDSGGTGEKQLYGIPLDKCTGLTEIFQPKGMVMAIPIYADKNIANTIATVNWMLGKTYEPKLMESIDADKKVEISVLAHSFRADNADAWQTEIYKMLGAGEQAVSITLDTYHVGREFYTADTIAANIKKGSGTAWIVPEDIFLPLAQAGVLRSLDDEIASFRIPDGTDNTLGQASVMKDGKPGESHQYGIPLDKCEALAKLAVPDGMILVFPSWGKNTFNYENAKAAVNWILTAQREPEKTAQEKAAEEAAAAEAAEKAASSAEPTATAQ